MKPLHPCAVSTCPTLTDKPRCPEHSVTREQRNPRDPRQVQFYGSTQWKAIRKVVIAHDPICKMCHRTPSTTAHHKDNNWQNNDPSNHEGVCDPCHRKHSGREHYRKRINRTVR